ncbi:flagellar biosynthetic protein FliO [Vagococcus sp.]|uniref:flagellar biosynthetic protein FliO n=1 Tax=Vagococcus sp. TaxID=1933889 RepID=UPI003F9448C5
MEQMLMLLKGIFFLIIVVMLAHFSIRYFSRFLTKQSQNIEIIDRLVIGKDSSLCIAKICNTYYLMTVSQNKVEIVRELDGREVADIKNKQDQREKKEIEKLTNYQQAIQSVASRIESKFRKRN